MLDRPAVTGNTDASRDTIAEAPSGGGAAMRRADPPPHVQWLGDHGLRLRCRRPRDDRVHAGPQQRDRDRRRPAVPARQHDGEFLARPSPGRRSPRHRATHGHHPRDALRSTLDRRGHPCLPLLRAGRRARRAQLPLRPRLPRPRGRALVGRALPPSRHRHSRHRAPPLSGPRAIQPPAPGHALPAGNPPRPSRPERCTRGGPAARVDAPGPDSRRDTVRRGPRRLLRARRPDRTGVATSAHEWFAGRTGRLHLQGRRRSDSLRGTGEEPAVPHPWAFLPGGRPRSLGSRMSRRLYARHPHGVHPRRSPSGEAPDRPRRSSLQCRLAASARAVLHPRPDRPRLSGRQGHHRRPAEARDVDRTLHQPLGCHGPRRQARRGPRPAPLRPAPHPRARRAGVRLERRRLSSPRRMPRA
jgi:hypothetical protein